MADTVTSQTIMDGTKTTVMKFTNVSDGTGETAVVKADASALLNAPTKLKIMRMWAMTNGMAVNVLFDATADVLALTAPADEAIHLDFRSLSSILKFICQDIGFPRLWWYLKIFLRLVAPVSQSIWNR